MKLPQGGGCHCGAIRYEITAEPIVTYACHCTDCQRMLASPFSLGMAVYDDDFRILRGTPKSYVRFGSGPRGSQALVLAAKAHAASRGEAAADVENVLALALPALRHRLVLSYRAEVDGVKDADVVASIVRQVTS